MFRLKSVCHGVFTPTQEFSIMRSQKYILSINWKKYVQCPRCFISLHYFKQHIRCDQKTQYFLEKSSGRCSSEWALCSSVKTPSKWQKEASQGLDQGSMGICTGSSWVADGLWLPLWSQSCSSIFHFSFTQWTASAHTVCYRSISYTHGHFKGCIGFPYITPPFFLLGLALFSLLTSCLFLFTSCISKRHNKKARS